MRQIMNCSVWKWIRIFALRRNSHITGCMMELSRIGRFFELTITCRALFLIFKDSGEVDAGTADVLVDGEFRFTADPHVNNWLHCNAVLVFQEKETAAHTVRIQMSGENLDKKFTILGFGYVE